MSDSDKSGSKQPAPAQPASSPAAGGSHASGGAPGGNPRHAPLPDGSNRVPDDAKGYNPGSVVTGNLMRNR
jgi:hypothetical protein